MKLEEVLPALREGKRARSPRLTRHGYLQIIDDNLLYVNECLGCNEWVVECEALLAEDWKVLDD